MASKLRARTRGKLRKRKSKSTRDQGIIKSQKKTKKKVDYSQLSGRDAAIVKSQKKTRADKIKEAEQSVGSLDRRINQALEDGDKEKVKDLRSRLNKFTKTLGQERAIQAGGVLRNKDGKIIRDSSGNPVLTGTGKKVYDLTKNVDFIDPTRRMQNIYPDMYDAIYPFSSQLQRGLPGTRIVKGFLGIDDKDTPYRYPETGDVFGKGAFPAQRYPLDWILPSDRQEPLDEKPFSISDRQPGLDWEKPTPLGKDEITDKDRQAAIDRGITEEFIFPVQDDLTTDIIETGSSDGSALQLAEAANTKGELADIVEEITNQKNLNKYPYQNVFALPKEVKENFNKEAEENRKTYEMETYGREITPADLAKAGISESWYEQRYDTPIVQKQLFQADVIDEKNVQTPIVKDVEAARSGNLFGQLVGAPVDLAGKLGLNVVPGYNEWADYIRNEAFVKPNTYSGQEWLDKQAADKATAINNIQVDNTLNDTQKIQLTDLINNPPDMSTGLLDQNNLSLSDMVVNENFDTGVNTDQGSLDVLNSLAEEPNYLKRLFRFNQ